MAVRNALYLFEVVVESVKSYVESRVLVIRSEFGDVFSLELKDPKQLYIVIPEPPPPPPEPPGKKKKKPKPKKKGKVKEAPPPPEPVIQSGQSLLFTSNAEFLIQTMKEFPLEVSLWNKEDSLTFIGASIIQWDPVFIKYLEGVFNCESPPPPVVRDEYNVFEEGTAKLMARVGLQVKLRCLTETVTSSFRTLTEDPVIKRVLYTGMNSKTTSYICNYKTTDEDFEENCNKIENSFMLENPPLPPINAAGAPKLVFANYKNAPAANIAVFEDDKYCCLNQADRPPESKYKAPETCPDIDFIVDYVRKVITSCNDNMRMLTPRPTIRPRVKATDIDRLCYCRETRWPEGDLAERFKREVKAGPCPLCINAKPPGAPREKTMDIANVRGPCGRPDCKIARDLRAYLERQLAEDNVQVSLDDIIGPCGSKVCTVAERIQQFIRHEGVFNDIYTKEGLQTQCDCVAKMQEALFKIDSCSSACSKDCKDSDSENMCEGDACPFNKKNEDEQKDMKVYNVCYFTVQYDFDNKEIESGPESDGASTPKTVSSKTLTSKTNRCKVEASSHAPHVGGGTARPMLFADYKNAPSTNIALFEDDQYCCMNQADRSLASKYNVPETGTDVDFIVDRMRQVITSCNDSMRMLTSRPTIRPRVNATDIDRLCYCSETRWPEGDLAERFKKEVKTGPCPLCTTKPRDAPCEKTIDIANVRGPCGRADCKIAKDMRAYLERQLEEENALVSLDDIIGPCGSKDCTVAERIQDFIRHDGVFKRRKEGIKKEGSCNCVAKMQEAIFKTDSCSSMCSKDCKYNDSGNTCQGNGSQFNKKKRNEDEQKKLKVYHVYYFTVQYDLDDKEAASGSKSDGASTPKTVSSKTSKKDFSYCPDECPTKISAKTTCSKNSCARVTAEKDSVEVLKCIEPYCRSKIQEGIVSPADSNIIIKMDDILNPCCVKSCDVAETVKDFIEEGYLKRQADLEKKKDEGLVKEAGSKENVDDACYCACECSFKFTSKTTYCGICGGFESMGDDAKALPDYAKPHPCPIYHKLYDRNKIVVKSPWPEENVPPSTTTSHQTPTTGVTPSGEKKQSRKTASSQQAPAAAGGAGAAAAVAAEKKSFKGANEPKQNKIVQPIEDKAKAKKKSKAPVSADASEQVGAGAVATVVVNNHAITCIPERAAVPKNMGWLWTAEDIPGLKPRPKSWKPGAVNKVLVRRYRQVREGVDIIAKKKRAMMSKKKKIEMKPTLIVKKTEGEYTVQMEVFRKYSKERLLFQYPYEEKPPLMYVIGKTEEEKIKTQKKRERRERRENRRKNRLIQSTFRDKCQEICLKAYNQAMGVLPLPNPNDPNCPCETQEKAPSPIIDSCSCSDSVSITSSDTDGDDWIIEFTPPAARWDAKAKHAPGLNDNETQYTYLDYKVKLIDKQGNPVPRYFKGPDGKQECSDLGGFWGPGHVWLEIHKDGYVGPDNRWVPLNFTGPDGMFYTSDEGVFTDHNGQVLRIGIDGYIDADGKWAWYSKKSKVKGSLSSMTTATDVKKQKKMEAQKTVESKDAKVSAPSPKLAEKKVEKKHVVTTEKKPTKNVSASEKVIKPKKAMPVTAKGKSPVVMNVTMDYDGRRAAVHQTEKQKPLDIKKLNRYREIMQGLKIYDDLCELEMPNKTNRACNTPRKKISPFTMEACYNNRRQTPRQEQFVASSHGASTSTSCKS